MGAREPSWYLTPVSSGSELLPCSSFPTCVWPFVFSCRRFCSPGSQCCSTLPPRGSVLASLPLAHLLSWPALKPLGAPSSPNCALQQLLPSWPAKGWAIVRGFRDQNHVWLPGTPFCHTVVLSGMSQCRGRESAPGDGSYRCCTESRVHRTNA